MKTLWTPWRMSYIREAQVSDGRCVFETGATGSHDKSSLLLYRDGLSVVLLNRYPYANGHLLVAPVRHVADITELTDEEANALHGMIRESVVILRIHMQPDGFNIGLNLGTVAGAGQPEHLHYHIVPRWEGDHNYMTVLAEVRTIPEHIEKTFDRLLHDFQELLKSEDKR